jgi:formate--tetrahydrofolate ligase
MLSDIEIAQKATLRPIIDIAKQLSIQPDDLIPYGRYIAKIQASTSSSLKSNKQGNLILVTAISPTPAGEGKTTTTIGLADALNLIGAQTVACLREPSLGPVFGMKGVATGGGYSQVVPMENINLHFTGDFHAISSANNLLAALVDNHIYHGNALRFKAVTWRRCLDMNDRAIRRVTTHSKTTFETGFDITVASEVMAIFCLAEDLNDLAYRIGQIQVGMSEANEPILASDLKAEGAMVALLKDAFQPNLVQTLAYTPAIVHGGPFANIAHGCNSVVATKTALKLGDYVVTEAGFGADLGAEKFIDIKCRQSGLMPKVAVLVATIRALKYHGGMSLSELNQEHIECLALGFENLKKHLDNLRNAFGLPVVVALNHFSHDTDAEIKWLSQAVHALGYEMAVCKHWAEGANGATDLARLVLNQINDVPSSGHVLYPDTLSLRDKVATVATRLYGAKDVDYRPLARKQLASMQAKYGHLPVCIAKTQYSFSCDPQLRNNPMNHTLVVRELRLSRGAGFIVVICGDIMTMPGLPEKPASERIGVNVLGQITGLS